MQNVRTVLARHQAYKRARRLWQDCTDSFQGHDDEEVDRRLSTFLSNFKETYTDFAHPCTESTDSIFGDCTDTLLVLLNIAEAHFLKCSHVQSPTIGSVNAMSALEAIETLLRDGKYRRVIVGSTSRVLQVLNLLTASASLETTNVLLQTINSLGFAYADRITLGKCGVFGKLKSLLDRGDEGLSRRTLKTLKNFLSDDWDECGNINGDAELRLRQEKYQDDVERKMQAVAENITCATFCASVSAAAVQQSVAILLDCAEAGLFPPSPDSLQTIYDACDVSRYAATTNDKLKDATQAEQFDVAMGAGRTVQLAVLMRNQGILCSLTSSMAEVAQPTQLQMIDIICRLLQNDAWSQKEFRQKNGYFRIQLLLDRPADYSVPEQKVFLLGVLNTIFTMALDGSAERLIGNTDSLRLLMNLVCASSHAEVQEQAGKTLHDLLTINYSNAAVLHSIRCDDVFVQLLLSQKIDKVASELVPASLVQHVAQLLQYMIFLLSPHNLQPLGNLVRSLAVGQSSTIPLTASVEDAMLRSISNILCDLRMRRAPIDCSQLVPTVLDMIRYNAFIGCITPSATVSTESRTRDENLLLLLEIFGIIMHDCCILLPVVEHANGLNLFTNIIYDNIHPRHRSGSISTGLCKRDTEIGFRHMALWIVQDMIASCCPAEDNLTNWLSTMLGSELPFELQVFVFTAIRDTISNVNARDYFRASGALDALVQHIVRGSNERLLEDALMTLDVIMRDCEESKVYITGKLLQGHYSSLFNRVKRSGQPMTSKRFQIILELVCIGPVYVLAAETSCEQESATDPADRNDQLSSIESRDEMHGGTKEACTADALPICTQFLSKTLSGSGTSWTRVQDSKFSPEKSGPWRTAIYKHLRKISSPQLLFVHGPPALTRSYAFLVTLQRRRERQTATDKHSSAMTQIQSKFNKQYDQRQTLDSASDTSSIRDSVDLAARDLALQTLLLESRANDSFIEEHNDARQSKSCGTSGEKDCLVDKTTPTANLVNLKTEDRGALDPQSMRSELRLGSGSTSSYWRPGHGWTMERLWSPPARSSYCFVPPLAPTVAIRGLPALNLLLGCVKLAGDGETQGKLVNSLLRLAVSSLAARRSLCHAGGLHRILELSLDSQFAKSALAQRLAHVLATAVGRYDITMGEVKGLFSMAYSRTRAAGQTARLLQVIAAISQRWEPVALAQLAGPFSAIRMPQLDRFPNQKNGYTLCMWLKFGATMNESGEALLFCWKYSQHIILELFFRTWPRDLHDDGTEERSFRRNLCARMRNSPCTHTEYFTFDEVNFDSNNAWYHLVLTHTKQVLNLFVNGHYVQSFQPLNYPLGVSKSRPLHGIIGYPQDSPIASWAGFSDHTNAIFCGEVGLFHVTDGVWDSKCVEIAAKSFPYGRNLQAMGIAHRQLLLFDPCSCPSAPAIDDRRDHDHSAHTARKEKVRGEEKPATIFVVPPLAHDTGIASERVRFTEQLSWKELHRKMAGQDSRFQNKLQISRPVILRNSSFDPFAARKLDWRAVSRRGRAAAAGVPLRYAGEASRCDTSTWNLPRLEHFHSQALIRNEGDPAIIVDQPISTSLVERRNGLKHNFVSAAMAVHEKKLGGDARIRTSGGLPVGMQDDLDMHQMGSLHDVAYAVGDFYLPLPFLKKPSPQRALGVRILFEFFYASGTSVTEFREANGCSVLLHLLKGWGVCGVCDVDPAYDVLFEMLREQALPAEETMTLVVDLLLIDNTPLEQNIFHWQGLSDLLLQASAGEQCERERPLHQDGAVVHTWKNRCIGMAVMMELLSRSSGESTRLLLEIVKLTCEPTFTAEDLAMLLEFCVTSVEGQLFAVIEGSDTGKLDIDVPYNSVKIRACDHARKHGVRYNLCGVDTRLPACEKCSFADYTVISEDIPDVVNVPYGSGSLPQGFAKRAHTDGKCFNDLEYVYGYNSHTETGVHSAEIDSELAHRLGIADCDFHEVTSALDTLDTFVVGESEKSFVVDEVDYAAQVFEVKLQTMIFVREALVTKVPNIAVELLRAAGGFYVLFALLNSPDERSRLLALDLLGLLLCHGKSADIRAFAVAGGFDTVGKYLVRQWVSRPVGWALLFLATRTPTTSVDFYDWLAGRCKLTNYSKYTKHSSPCASAKQADDCGEGGSPAVVNFEALYCLLQLLHFGTVDRLVAHDMAKRVAEIVVLPQNLEQLITNNFPDWFFAFMTKVQRHTAGRRGSRQGSHVIQAVRQIYRQWLLSHLSRPFSAKTLKHLRKAIADAAEFGIHLLEDVLSFFKENPVFAANDANNVIKNLASVLEQVEESIPTPVATCVSIVALINKMAARNNSTARKFMMTHKLLDTRDFLVLHCLKCNSSIEACYELAAMPFESVFEQPSFHEKLGPLFLLRHMHQTHSDPSLQVLFTSVIKLVCTVLENRKLVERVIADSVVSARLLGNATDAYGENVNQGLRIAPTRDLDGISVLEVSSDAFLDHSALDRLGSCRSPLRGQPINATGHMAANSPARLRPVSPSSSIGSATSGGDEEYNADSMEDTECFLEWYYSPAQSVRRGLIETRIEKALASSAKSWRRLHERQVAGRAKAFRSRQEACRVKEVSLLDGFNEQDKKVRARVEAMGANHVRRVQQCIIERCGRASEGQVVWENIVRVVQTDSPSR